MAFGTDPSDGRTVDLLVRIGGRSPATEAYPTEARIDGEGTIAKGAFRVGSIPPQLSSVGDEVYGTALFYELFSGELAEAYDRAGALVPEGRLRVRLWIEDEAAELHVLNWEAMHSLRAGFAGPLAASGRSTLSRYHPGPVRSGLPLQTDTVRMAVIVADPSDLDRYGLTPLDPDGEVRAFAEAIGSEYRGTRLSVTVLPGHRGLSAEARDTVDGLGWRITTGPSSLPAITRVLSDVPGQNIVHLVCHGAHSRQEGEGRLFLEAEDGTAEPVTGSAVAVALAALDPAPVLVTLVACSSARRDSALEGNAPVGIAPKLVAAGIPAVLAMQDAISLRVARSFTVDVYRDLLRRGQVAGAVSRARSHQLQAREPEWTVPVLVTSLGDDRLLVPDPVALALRSLAASPDLNPLPNADDYMPLTAVRVPVADWASGAAAWTPPLGETAQPLLGSDAVKAVLTCLSEAGAGMDDAPTTATTIVLDGELGSGKSVLLRRIGRKTAEASAAPGVPDVVIPVLLDFERDLGPSHGASDIVQMILDALRPHWPLLAFGHLADMMAAPSGPRIRVFVDGLEQLPAGSRDGVVRDLGALARIFPRQQLVIAGSPTIDRAPALPITHVLSLQSLSPRTVAGYLAPRGQVGQDLLDALEYAGALDLASQPWALVKLLQRAGRGQFPASRLSVVEGILDDDVLAITGDATMQHRVMATLDALAWRISRSLSPGLDVDVAFELMSEVRSARTYDLEALLSALVERGVLTTCGDDRVRFARASVQALCSARGLAAGNTRRVLDDIAATLGRRTRLYWWWDVLVFYTGLVEDPGRVVRQIVLGAPLGGDQFLLAARMVREVGVDAVPLSLVDYIVRSLRVQLDSEREPRLQRRVEAVQALGEVDHPAAIASLRGICLAAPSEGVSGDESTGERVAAFLALSRHVGPRRRAATSSDSSAVPARSNSPMESVLTEILDDWYAEDIVALSERLVDLEGQAGDGQVLFPLVASAIATLQTPAALEVLVQLFFYARDLAWSGPSLATALSLMDSAEVTRRVIMPVIDAQACLAEGLPDEICAARERFEPGVIPLAGRLGPSDSRLLAFLRRTMRSSHDANKVGLAIHALGQALDKESRPTLEAVAMGNLDVLAGLVEPDVEVRVDLRRRAVGALARVGDSATLRKLQSDTSLWVPALELALTAACEEMLWREITTDTEGTV